MKIDRNTVNALGRWCIVLAFLFAGVIAEFKGQVESAFGFFICSAIAYFLLIAKEWKI